MKLVVEIDEATYKDIKKGKVYSSLRDVPQESVLAIANGIVLPEKHGRLIDADDIALIDEQFYTPSDYYVAESAINDAPTIIDADTESGEQA